MHRVQRSAQAVAQIDVLCSLADVACEQNYVCPTVDLSDKIEIHDGRHPVVEKMLKDSMFIPNDTLLDEDENRIAIITGPNMAGKSTYMRQVALITIMAQDRLLCSGVLGAYRSGRPRIHPRGRVR